MSEVQPITPEHRRPKETEPEPDRSPERQHKAHERSHVEKAGTKDQIEKLAHQAKQEALSGQDVSVEDNRPKQNQLFINRELKLDNLKRTLVEIRRKLSKPERTLSKVIHQPMIDKISSFGEKTVARPSGVLGAGIAALIGSSVVLYIAKHYGFDYNLSIFFILLFAGYLVGLIIEAFIRLLKHKR